MKTNTKQTAANNQTLAAIKKAMNSKIYARALALVNSEGEQAAQLYVNTFFRPECPMFPNVVTK